MIIAVHGDVDLNTEPQLSACLTRSLTTDECPRLIVDLSHTTFVSATGLALLAQAHNTARAHDGWLRITAPSDLVRRSLIRGGFQDKIPIAATPEAACHGSERPDPPTR
ncbi:MAG: anti-sigma factor antagonist [Pseudonocardiaceae bacterium]|nr:anti-sigma factor antagonist [Pseudonocardiaceae bacterium]